MGARPFTGRWASSFAGPLSGVGVAVGVRVGACFGVGVGVGVGVAVDGRGRVEAAAAGVMGEPWAAAVASQAASDARASSAAGAVTQSTLRLIAPQGCRTRGAIGGD